MVAITVLSEFTKSPNTNTNTNTNTITTGTSTSTSSMASSPLIFNTAKQLTLLLIITILTLSLILWLTELDTIHCSNELINDRKFIASPEFNLSTNSSSSLSINSLVPFRSAFKRATSSGGSTFKLESSSLLISTIFSYFLFSN